MINPIRVTLIEREGKPLTKMLTEALMVNEQREVILSSGAGQEHVNVANAFISEEGDVIAWVYKPPTFWKKWGVIFFCAAGGLIGAAPLFGAGKIGLALLAWLLPPLLGVALLAPYYWHKKKAWEEVRVKARENLQKILTREEKKHG